MSLEAEYDDLFLYAPSFLMAEGRVEEGKALGTANQQDLLLLQQIGKLKSFNPEEFASERKRGQTVGKRKLKQVQQIVTDEFTDLIDDYQKGEIDEKKFRKDARKRMKIAWRDVFLAGLRAGGAPGLGQGQTAMVKLGPGDDKWLKSAMKHESTFLNRFLDAVVEETYKMPLERRLKMYVDALEAFYDSARVIALPATTLIHWVGPKDKITCPSCRYMYVNSPFTKLTLPTTPRAGMTLCLTNCRDRLLVKSATLKQIKAREAELPARSTMIQHLRKIKRTGVLPNVDAVKYAQQQKG